MNLNTSDFNRLATTDQWQIMFEAGYQSGYEAGLTKEFDITPFLAAKKPKKTSFKKVVIQCVVGAVCAYFIIYGQWCNYADAQTRNHRIHSALGVLYSIRTDGMPIQESQDDPVPLLEDQ